MIVARPGVCLHFPGLPPSPSRHTLRAANRSSRPNKPTSNRPTSSESKEVRVIGRTGSVARMTAKEKRERQQRNGGEQSSFIFSVSVSLPSTSTLPCLILRVPEPHTHRANALGNRTAERILSDLSFIVAAGSRSFNTG